MCILLCKNNPHKYLVLGLCLNEFSVHFTTTFTLEFCASICLLSDLIPFSSHFSQKEVKCFLSYTSFVSISVGCPVLEQYLGYSWHLWIILLQENRDISLSPLPVEELCGQTSASCLCELCLLDVWQAHSFSWKPNDQTRAPLHIAFSLCLGALLQFFPKQGIES